MALEPDSSDSRRKPPERTRGRRPAPARKVRVLFGSPGWPSGLLEVASWAKQRGLAEAVIFQIQPGYAFRLASDDRQFLAEGPVDPEIVDSFVRRGSPLSDDSRVRPLAPGTWEIPDARRGSTYGVAEAGEGLDVTVLENLQTEELLAGIRAFARRKSIPDRFFEEDGSLRPAVRDAVMAVGGQFLGKLIEMDPHVVGFRLEGGRFDEVKRFIATVRLVSNAEIVLGGPTATSHPKEVLEDSGADYVFAGEAEESFLHFLRLAFRWNSKDLQPEIPGLAYRYSGRVYFNTLPGDGYERTVLETDPAICRKDRRCMQSAIRPVADARLITANRLDWSLLEGFRSEFDSLFFTGGRGCPGACTFCAKLHGGEVRVKPARQLLEEIEAADARVAAGAIKLTSWELFEHVDEPALKGSRVSWAAVYDEDFFLHRRRAIEFFRLWDRSPLKPRYRISLQTNPCSMLTAAGQVHAELFEWIDRLKPMVQLGAESFHPELLTRWHKRHNLGQLITVLDALDRTRQDYTVFQLLTDFDSTPEELVETLRLLILNAHKHRRMRIASSPFTIPLYDSDTRKLLEYRGDFVPQRIGHFTDYERPQPGWMDPLTAELADLDDAELQWTLQPGRRDAALLSAFEVVLQRILEEREKIEQDAGSTARQVSRIRRLHEQAGHAMDEIRDARFQGIEPQQR